MHTHTYAHTPPPKRNTFGEVRGSPNTKAPLKSPGDCPQLELKSFLKWALPPLFRFKNPEGAKSSPRSELCMLPSYSDPLLLKCFTCTCVNHMPLPFVLHRPGASACP